MNRTGSSRFFQISFLLFILFVLPISIYLVKQQQDTRQHAATGAELYAVASTSSVSAGQQIRYDIDIDTKSFVVDSVQINLTYPADKLEFISMDSQDSSFPEVSAGIGGSGLVEISRQSQTPISGKAKIVSLLFTAKQPVPYGVLHPGVGIQVTSLHQAVLTNTFITNKALIPNTKPQSIPFSFNVIFAAIFHLFGGK